MLGAGEVTLGLEENMMVPLFKDDSKSPAVDCCVEEQVVGQLFSIRLWTFCLSNLLLTCERLFQTMAEGCLTDVIYVDFRKTFDRVVPQRMI